jgi:hypothetical protein
LLFLFLPPLAPEAFDVEEWMSEDDEFRATLAQGGDGEVLDGEVLEAGELAMLFALRYIGSELCIARRVLSA